MKEQSAFAVRSALPSTIPLFTLGGILGGSLAAALVIEFIELLKAMQAVISRQPTWVSLEGIRDNEARESVAGAKTASELLSVTNNLQMRLFTLKASNREFPSQSIEAARKCI